MNHITSFINERNLKNDREQDVPCLAGFWQAAQNFISAIYNNKWDALKTDNNNIMFLFLFLNQQFITQSAKADCSSYFITTLNRTKQKEMKKKKKQKEESIKQDKNSIKQKYHMLM